MCWFLLFGGGGLLAALPLLLYALDPSNNYFSHLHQISLWDVPGSPWQSATGSWSRLSLLLHRWFDFWRGLSHPTQIELGDGTGAAPLVPLLLMFLVSFGAALRWERRSALLEISALAALLIPWGAIVTADSAVRRAFALSPLLAYVAALGLVELSDRLAVARAASSSSPARRRRIGFGLARAGLMLWGIAAVWQSFMGYFVVSAKSERVAWIFANEMTSASRFLNALPPPTHVYFYSNRWSCNYETRRFLAPQAHIENRSKEFGTFTFSPFPRFPQTCFLL